MFLKNSLSSTRKFISRTINSVKSFFNETTYQRLPKPPQFSCIGFDKTLSQRYEELDKFYSDFTNVHIIDDRHDSKTHTSSTKRFGDASKKCTREVKKSSGVDQDKIVQVCQRIEEEEEEISNSCKCVVVISKERRCLVAKKLKELDMSDVENVMDIQEILHYYSHLTSPVYMELFDKFFISIYADLFNFKFSRRAVAHCNTFSR